MAGSLGTQRTISNMDIDPLDFETKPLLFDSSASLEGYNMGALFNRGQPEEILKILTEYGVVKFGEMEIDVGSNGTCSAALLTVLLYLTKLDR